MMKQFIASMRHFIPNWLRLGSQHARAQFMHEARRHWRRSSKCSRYVKIQLLFLLCVLCGSVSGQTSARYAITGSGAPAGACVISGSGYAAIYINRTNGDWYTCSGTLGTVAGTWVLSGNHAAGLGSVTSVSVVTANGFSGSVGTANTTPAITINNPTALVATTSVQSPFYKSSASDPADAGAIRLGNGELIAWESNPTGTDKSFGLDTNNVFSFTAPVNATTGFQIGGAAASGNFLRGNATNFVSSTIQVADVPTLNQDTTGSAAKWTTARNLAGNSVDGSVNVAFANKFIVQGTADSGLSAAQFLGALGTGILKNTTITGVLSISNVTDDVQTKASIVPNTAPSAGQILCGNAGGTAYAPCTVGTDATLASTGALTLASVISAGGPTGSATVTPVITYDAKGRLTTVTTATIAPPFSAITGTPTTLAGYGITNGQLGPLTGDVTTSGAAATLKNTGTAGTYRSVTFDAQGRETSGTNPTTFSGYAISDTSANFFAAITDESGSGVVIGGTQPQFTTGIGIGVAATTGNSIKATEAAAPSGAASNDLLYPDSTAHRWKVNNNNAGADTLATFTDNLSVFASGGTIAPATINAFTLGGTIAGGANAINNVNINVSSPGTGSFTTLATSGQYTATGDIIQSGVKQIQAGSAGFYMNNSTSYAGFGDFTAAKFLGLLSDWGVRWTGATTGDATSPGTASSVTLSRASAGTLQIGTTANNALGSLNATNATFSGASINLPGLGTSSAATTGTLCWTTGTGLVNVDTTTTCLLSGEQFKQFARRYDLGLSAVMQLQPRSYFLKPEFNPTGLGEQVGFFAGEVAKVDSRLVSFEADGTPHAVRYQQMTALLVAAIQEMKTKMDAQQQEIDALKAKADHK